MKKTPNSKSATRRVLHLSYAGTPFKPSVGLSGMRRKLNPEQPMRGFRKGIPREVSVMG